MSTKKLAKELGILRQRSQSSNGSKKSLVSNQTFSYLIVIDFESTCWREKNNYSQEIIEFPAVLLRTSTGEIESEFHCYVQPQEHPILSEFCTELTGITQVQVEAGIPLQICLSRFSRWLQNLQQEMGLIFPKGQHKSSAPSASQKLCTFVTWSDWDLGVCLQYECKRKQLYKPDVLNSWIDLRSTYRLFYDRKPKGLNGALQDLGIQFSGREHSGLDDARNTAQLAARMMRDGCVMKITRSLMKTPLISKPVFGDTTADNKKEKGNTSREENTVGMNRPSSCRISQKFCDRKSVVQKMNKDLDTKENSSSVCQSLISPKTLLNGTATSLWGHSRRSVPAESVTNISSSVLINSPHSDNSSSTFVLCSTTVDGLSDLPQINQEGGGEEGEELFVETEDRCGSYDDVLLDGDTECISEKDVEFDVEYASGFDRRCHVRQQSENTNSAGYYLRMKEGTRETGSFSNNLKTQKKAGESSTTSICANNMRFPMDGSISLKEIEQHSTVSKPNFSFLAPKPLNSKSNHHKAGLKPKPFIPEKTSTSFASFAKPKPVFTQLTTPKQTLKSSFTIYTDPEKPSSSSMCGSFFTPKSTLSSLSTNTLSSRVNQSSNQTISKGGHKITSPLCACGRRAKRQVVSNGGPNHGKGFYCCPVRRSGSGGRIQKGCEYFKWESALMKSSPGSSPAIRSSVSFCQMNSTLTHQKPLIRKSY
ncbi:ERI1 exoribonuclease 2 [Halichoeres trimaculatus]|uniref:ERI1 exoribonuclease 2 n=1 Tax=Halichoeres trimaculatus TaxID=147232 RepID=UPI003D9E5BF6